MNERQIGIEKMRNADHGDKSRADALTIPRDLLNDLIDDVQSFADQVPCREREKAFRADLLARARAIAAFPVEQPAAAPNPDAELGAFVRLAVAQLADSPKSFLSSVQRAIGDQREVAIFANETGSEGAAASPAADDRKYTQADMERYGRAVADAREKRTTATAQPAQADAPAEAREPVAWVTDDDRAITAAQKQRALADGGATASSVRPYSIPCYAVSAPADAGEAVAHMRVRSTDAGSTSHAIDIAPEAAALDLKPGEYLLYLAPPTTRAAHLTTTLSPDQRISMAAKLFFFANELLNGADQS
ncbi:hypothetical protein [Burkholderia pseudomallei]|uniref:hypothetical protein n=1 Tax=Burkholderia pseudomallei TaxID=28450 RepID=UPI0019234B25|nr:hypothetical protein [Burkholderia pseudomallei]